eukprot:4947079-Prymnesium_polylepis.1
MRPSPTLARADETVPAAQVAPLSRRRSLRSQPCRHAGRRAPTAAATARAGPWTRGAPLLRTVPSHVDVHHQTPSLETRGTPAEQPKSAEAVLSARVCETYAPRVAGGSATGGDVPGGGGAAVAIPGDREAGRAGHRRE